MPVSLPRSYHRNPALRDPIEFGVVGDRIGYLAVNIFGDPALVAACDRGPARRARRGA